MYTFFHGSRRKAGCVLLVMACVVAMCWVRSRMVIDAMGWHNTWMLASVDARVFMRVPKTAEFADQPWGSFRWGTSDFVPFDSMFLGEFEWHGRFLGFAIGTEDARYGCHYCIIPYWSIAVPMTMLSACSLLWPEKPKFRRSGCA